LDVDLVGEGEVGLEQPGGEVTKGSQGKFAYGIIIKNVKEGPENIKHDDGNAKENNKSIFAAESEKIEKVFIPAAVDYRGVRGCRDEGHDDRHSGGFYGGQQNGQEKKDNEVEFTFAVQEAVEFLDYGFCGMQHRIKGRV
jgi:hypothetical protein